MHFSSLCQQVHSQASIFQGKWAELHPSERPIFKDIAGGKGKKHRHQACFELGNSGLWCSCSDHFASRYHHCTEFRDLLSVHKNKDYYRKLLSDELQAMNLRAWFVIVLENFWFRVLSVSCIYRMESLKWWRVEIHDGTRQWSWRPWVLIPDGAKDVLNIELNKNVGDVLSNRGKMQRAAWELKASQLLSKESQKRLTYFGASIWD